MKGQQPVRLSDVVPTLPEGEKLTATDKGIETLDYVNWNASKIKFINLQFNNIETLRGLGQFGNLQGIDLSNNNIASLSDLRLLSLHPSLEFIDLSNCPITHHDYYRVFVAIFVQNVKMLDRLPISKKEVESIRSGTEEVKDVLTTLLVNFLKIVSAKSILARLAINDEIRAKFGVKEEPLMNKHKAIELLQKNIIESFDDFVLIEFESFILDDLEILMENCFKDKSFVEAWGSASREFGAEQIDRLQKYLRQLELDDKTIKRIAFRQVEEEVNKSVEEIPPPVQEEQPITPSRYQVQSLKGNTTGTKATRHVAVIANSGAPSNPRYAIEVSATLHDSSIHMKNCMGVDGSGWCSCPSNKKRKTQSPGGQTVIEKMNNLQKRSVELEDQLKDKTSSLIKLEREHGEMERAIEDKEINIEMLEEKIREKGPIENEVLELKKVVVELQQACSNIDDLRNRIQQLRQEKEKMTKRLNDLKKKLKDHEEIADMDEEEVVKMEIAKQHVLKKVFEGWKAFSIVRAKLTLLLKIKGDKMRTKLFTSWKRAFMEYKKDNLEVLQSIKELKQARLKEELNDEKEEVNKKKDLEDLRRRLERTPPKRIIGKAKLERKRLNKVAETHYKKQQESKLGEVFFAWKEASAPYRKEKRITTVAEQRQILRTAFNGFKEFTSTLKKANEIALERKGLDKYHTKRRCFAAIKDLMIDHKEKETRLANTSMAGYRRFFKAWRTAFKESQEVKNKEKFLKFRLTKIRKEAFFDLFKLAVSTQKRQNAGIQKALKARETCYKRRKLIEFSQKTNVCHRVGKKVTQKTADTRRGIFNALKEHARANRKQRNALSNLASLLSNLSLAKKSLFLSSFISTMKREINKDKAVEEFLLRRKQRIGAYMFEVILTDWIRAKKQKLAAAESKVQDLETFRQKQTESSSRDKDSHTTLQSLHSSLHDQLSQANRDIVSIDEEIEERKPACKELEDRVAALTRELTDTQIRLKEQEGSIEAMIKVQIEAIADLGAGINAATDDVTILTDCLNSRKDKQFMASERLKTIERELEQQKKIHKLKTLELVQDKSKSTSRLSEIGSKTDKLNDCLDEAEKEIALLKRKIAELEVDSETADKIHEEITTARDLKSTRGETNKLAVQVEKLKDNNTQLETELLIQKIWNTQSHAPAKPVSNQNFTTNHSPSTAKFGKQQALITQSNTAQVDPYLEQYTTVNSRFTTGQGSPSPVNAQGVSANIFKTADYEEHSTLNNSQVSAHNHNYSARDYSDTDTLFQDMHEDLKIMRIRREGMVEDLMGKLKAIEGELFESIDEREQETA